MIAGLANSGKFTAFVVFVGGEHGKFWRVFTKRGYRHVFVIVPGYGPAATLATRRGSVIVNQTGSAILIDYAASPPNETAEHMIGCGVTRVLKIRVDRSKSRGYVPRGIQTCVSVVKSILGISAWLVWTPHQLERYLLRQGASIVSSSDEFRVQTPEGQS